MVTKYWFAPSVFFRAVLAFETLSPSSLRKGPPRSGREGDWCIKTETDSHRMKGTGDPSETHVDHCGRISKGEHTSGGLWVCLYKE